MFCPRSKINTTYPIDNTFRIERGSRGDWGEVTLPLLHGTMTTHSHLLFRGENGRRLWLRTSLPSDYRLFLLSGSRDTPKRTVVCHPSTPRSNVGVRPLKICGVNRKWSSQTPLRDDKVHQKPISWIIDLQKKKQYRVSYNYKFPWIL